MSNETQFPTLGFPEESADLPPLTQIGEFQILSILGKGGMGVVYEAQQRDPERHVALKVLRGGRLADEMQLRLFRREAQTLARLIHPNIAALYEAGRTGDGLSFFTMELVRGEPLDKYVMERMGGDRPSPAQLRERLRLFATVCRAVAYAHQRGVIHRDLKPSNILVINDAEGSSPSISISGPPVPTVKILDFGLARMTDNDVEATQLSRVGDIRGTLAYMSPEQARGDTREIDLRSDVYSLGVTLYETITGRFPYDVKTSSLMGVLKIIIDEPPRPLQQAFKGGYRLDPDLWTITEKALEKEPDRRYASADALAEDIERYLANRPILAHPPSTTYQVRKLVSRHRFGFATAAAFLALLVAGAVLLAVQADKIRRERDRATQEAARATAINQFLQKTLGAADPWQRGGSRGVTLVDALKQSEKQVHGSFKGQPLVEADVLEAIAKTYHSLGEYADAERLLRSALATRIAAEGRDTDGVAETLAALGETLQVQRKADESEKLLRESLAIREKLHGRESAEAAATLNELARTLVNKSDYKEAEKLARESLAIRERIVGPVTDEAAETHRTLCSLYTDQEEWKKALEECGRQVAIRRELHEDGPELGGALNDVAVVQTQLSDYDAAEKTFDEAMAINLRVLGEDHPEIASGLENIGNIWYRRGEYAKTAEQLEKVLAIRRRALGEDAEPVGRTMANLGSVYMSSGNDAAALPKFKDGLVRLEKFLGPDHPDVAAVLTGEAAALLHLGRLDEAETVARRALAIRMAKFPETSVPIALTRTRLGQILTAKKRYPEADSLLRKASDSLAAAGAGAASYAQNTTRARVALYDAWGKKAEAQALQAQLDAGAAKAAK